MPEDDEPLETVLIGTTDGTSQPVAAGSASAAPEVPGYRLLSLLGQGGMGQVYLAEHLDLKRRVALKLVSAGGLARPETLQRFRAESRAVAAVRHPGVCQIFEAGHTGQVPFLAMEYIDGQTLTDVVRQQLPEPRQAAEYCLAVAEAIEACHQAGILHRDLKPSNVMLDNRGMIRVMDFGLAKSLSEGEQQTRTGEILGTPGYMAPEQASGVVKQLSPACDVYAIGTILYELLTGRPPFATPDIMQTMMLVLTADPLPPRQLQPKIPVDLETICLKCLRKRPQQRYASAAELAADLHRFLKNQPVLARQTSRLEKMVKWSRRHPALSVLLAMVCLAGTAAAVGAMFHVQRMSTELQRSQRLLDGMTDFGQWLVTEHVPKVARLRGGSQQQAELVSQTLNYLKQIQQDVGADRQLIDYVAQAYLQIAAVQADPAFATADRLRQAIDSATQAVQLYRGLSRSDADPALVRSLADSLLIRSRLYQRSQNPRAAAADATQAQQLLPDPNLDSDANTRAQLLVLAARYQRLSLNADDQTWPQLWTQYRLLQQHCQQLQTAQPDTPLAGLLAKINLDLAEILQQAGGELQPDAAVTVAQLYAEAVAKFEQIHQPTLTDYQDHASALAKFAAAVNAEQQPDRARQLASQAVQRQQQVYGEIPESEIVLQTLLQYQQQLFELIDDDLKAAQQIASDYLQNAEALALADPARHRQTLQQGWLMLADVNRQQHRFAEAEALLQQAVASARDAATESPAADRRSRLAEFLFQLASLWQTQANDRATAGQRLQLLQQAEAALQEAVDLSEQVAEPADQPEGARYWDVIAALHRTQEDLEDQRLRLRESGNLPLPADSNSPPPQPLQR